MGISTRSASRPQPIQKSTVAKTTTPVGVRSQTKRQSKSPTSVDDQDIPHFTLRLNVPRLPAETKPSNSKGYDHYKEHGKKAIHFKVAKEETNYFRYLSVHAHRLKLEVKYFGKFAKYTGTLGNNAPLSNCTRLRRCIQGHLNYHLSSTSITLNGIDMLDASEYLHNPAGKSIICLTLRDLMYRIKLESEAPLFLQLSQHSSEEVDAVIPNTAEAEIIQGHLNYHLSSTSITLNGIDMLNASEHLRGPTGRSLVRPTLRDLLYRITLESRAPLFLQLSQRPSGKVDAVVPNSPEAELMAERMNVQITAWCHFYWKDTNPGAEKFYRKLSDRAFSHVLLHEIADCTWDAALKAVISPNSRFGDGSYHGI
jgi:hypothetical protein